MITDLEPDILEGEVKWASGSSATNKTSGDDGIPAELFQILKDDTVKVVHSIYWQIWKLSSGHRTGKSPFDSSPKEGLCPSLNSLQTISQLHSFDTLSRLCSKFSKLGLLRQPFCCFAFLLLGDGLDPRLLYNVMNLHQALCLSDLVR